jgi:hypothetical protein
MPSGGIDEPPGRITANADGEQTDADDEPPPPLTSPTAANAEEAQNEDDAAGVAVDAR